MSRSDAGNTADQGMAEHSRIRRRKSRRTSATPPRIPRQRDGTVPERRATLPPPSITKRGAQKASQWEEQIRELRSRAAAEGAGDRGGCGHRFGRDLEAHVSGFG